MRFSKYEDNSIFVKRWNNLSIFSILYIIYQLNGVKLNSEFSEINKSPLINFFKIEEISFRLYKVFSFK